MSKMFFTTKTYTPGGKDFYQLREGTFCKSRASSSISLKGEKEVRNICECCSSGTGVHKMAEISFQNYQTGNLK